jgi:predicted site-specific integrase-resolvase
MRIFPKKFPKQEVERLTVQEYCKKKGITRQTLGNWVNHGLVSKEKSGNRVIIVAESDVQKWLSMPRKA